MLMGGRMTWGADTCSVLVVGSAVVERRLVGTRDDENAATPPFLRDGMLRQDGKASEHRVSQGTEKNSSFPYPCKILLHHSVFVEPSQNDLREGRGSGEVCRKGNGSRELHGEQSGWTGKE